MHLTYCLSSTSLADLVHPTPTRHHAATPTRQGADKLEHVATEHFWMSGMYWGLTAMALVGRLDQMDSAKILDWVSFSEECGKLCGRGMGVTRGRRSGSRSKGWCCLAVVCLVALCHIAGQTNSLTSPLPAHLLCVCPCASACLPVSLIIPTRPTTAGDLLPPRGWWVWCQSPQRQPHAVITQCAADPGAA